MILKLRTEFLGIEREYIFMGNETEIYANYIKII